MRMTGSELQERRKLLEMTQEKLARALDVALSTVARWEQDPERVIRNSTMLDLALTALESQAAEKQKDSRSKKRG